MLLRKGENALEVLERVRAKVAEINRADLPAGRARSSRTTTARRSSTARCTRCARTWSRGSASSSSCSSRSSASGTRGPRSSSRPSSRSRSSARSCCSTCAGIPANLISMGAIDFGIIVDSAVVVVENLLRILEERGGKVRSLSAAIVQATSEVGKPILFSKAILITAFLPLYTLQRVEGKIFRPMALTLTFALLVGHHPRAHGRAGPRELRGEAPQRRARARARRNPRRSEFLTRLYRPALARVLGHRKAVVAAAAALLAGRRRHGARSSAPSSCPSSTRARSGCARRCRARSRRPRPARLVRQVRDDAGVVPGGEDRRQPARAAGRRHGRERLRHGRALRRPRSRARSGRPRTTRDALVGSDEPEAVRDPGHRAHVLAGHRGQRERGGLGHQGRARHQDLRRGPRRPAGRSPTRPPTRSDAVPGAADVAAGAARRPAAGPDRGRPRRDRPLRALGLGRRRPSSRPRSAAPWRRRSSRASGRSTSSCAIDPGRRLGRRVDPRRSRSSVRAARSSPSARVADVRLAARASPASIARRTPGASP